MSNRIFVNLPVSDLNKSMDFFRSLGWSFNPQFTDETAACMIVSDNINVMLLTREKFSRFTKKSIGDASTAEVLIAIGVEEKDAVDRIAEAALKSGGTEAMPPQDYGFMQLRSFLDLDGHHWEMIYMDPAHAPPQG